MIARICGVALIGAAVALAPPATADTTMTAAEICAKFSPGSYPVVNYNQGACGRGPAPGLFTSLPWIRGFMDDNFHGAYPVDPNIPFSDWIIPSGVAEGTSKPEEGYMWQTDPGVWQGPCPPTCPSFG